MNADVIVAGLGAMGASATYQLARRGVRVLGIDRYRPPHAIGSTHGDTRVTRLATVEGAEYVPLVARSHEVWRELERATGQELLTQCGLLQIAPSGAAIHGATGLVETSSELARRFGIPHEILNASELRQRFPQFAVRDDHIGYFEPGGGFVRPEACVNAQLEQAAKLGAELLFDTHVTALESSAHGITATTERGERYEAGALILATGQWVGRWVGRSSHHC